MPLYPIEKRERIDLLSMERFAAQLKHVPLWVFAALFLWPVALVVVAVGGPVLLATCAVHFALSVCRASSYRPSVALRLLRYIVKQILFLVLNFPLVIQIGYHQVAADDDCVTKNIPFIPDAVKGRLPDNRLDIYGFNDGRTRDVVIFIYGGAWGAGTRWWYSRLAMVIRDICDVVVVVPDYPTYPTGTIVDMVETLHYAACWTKANIQDYGGRGDALWLVGHSAGAHLAMMLVLRRAMALSNVEFPTSFQEPVPCARPISLLPGFIFARGGEPVRRSPTEGLSSFKATPQFRGVVLLAGVYDLLQHLEVEKRRGVDLISPMTPATGGYWKSCSPTCILKELAATNAILPAGAFPSTIRVYHASCDEVVAASQSEQLIESLAAHGAPCPNLILLPGSHSEIVLGPLRSIRMHPAISAIDAAVHCRPPES